MSQSDCDECFLLHQRSYGETSIIAEVFTKKNGRMSVIAKGAKKPKSKFFGYLAPFNKLSISYSGKSELKTLTSIDTNLARSENTLTKTSYSLLYINELLMKLLPKDAKQEDLFDLYEIFLNKVSSNEDLEITLRHFELDLLDMLGYGFDYDIDIDTNNLIDPNKSYSFVAEKGFREKPKTDTGTKVETDDKANLNVAKADTNDLDKPGKIKAADGTEVDNEVITLARQYRKE